MSFKRILFALLVLLAAAGSTAAHRRAALIGISRYMEGTGWADISSDNDIRLLGSVLSGWDDVLVLQNSDASFSGIVSFLRDIASSSSPGDTVLVHFSGHGQQMYPSAEIDEPDGLDEAFIPFDAYKSWSVSYDGGNHLRDGLMGRLVEAIRAACGRKGLVIVTLDSCHSDSMDRNDDSGKTVVRGTAGIFSRDTVPQDVMGRRAVRDTSMIAQGDGSPVVYISACGSHMKNREYRAKDGTGYGSLSYAFSSAYKRNGLSDMCSFLDAVHDEMHRIVPYQIPQVRASFQYSPPDPETSLKDEGPVHQDSSDGHHFPRAVLLVIASLFLFSIFTILWLKKK